ncbi:GLPGLI family protein [Flavobacterium lindanitolerans]|uniref:GLPGLI family protein n=1 Tax=Flavobacterium lindanitolerans TaxID=428988 RepID=A0A497VH89_9FLAO|nr:GLPGLI family protein [Flavobacterium lindanitolerans]PKW28462.1 GLPGLI family protein [Flavobacterium lindanitolerans]RLJ36033.1 GLPGLI family protein [Flavobacterium lindanitolerans]
MIKSAITAAIAATLFSFQLMQAQEFTGRATYQTKTIMNDIQISGSNMTPDLQASLEEKLKKGFEKTYELSFNKTESVYEEPQRLESPSGSSGAKMVVVNTSSSGDGKSYKNIKDKTVLSEEDFFGKEFLVSDSLPKWDWKLVDETKKIGNFTCYKAIGVIPVSKEDLERYEKMKNKKSESKTVLFTPSEPKDRTITVWYTPEIPVSHGPGEYWGLPGLIMEVNDAKTVILCSKIVLNPKDKVVIKMPKKGKKVTKKEYEALIEKQMESMKDSKGNIHINLGN